MLSLMEYKSYLARVEFDADANLFHGEVINTRDVITFQGKSEDELKNAFAESVEDYLAFCAERGERPAKPIPFQTTPILSSRRCEILVELSIAPVRHKIQAV